MRGVLEVNHVGSMSQVEKWEGLLCRASDFNGSHEKVWAFVKVDMGVKGEFV